MVLNTLLVGSITSVFAYSYAAKDIKYTPRDTSWQVTNVEDAIKDLRNNTGGSFNPILLWTNPNPTSVFSPQTINLDLSNYKYVILINKTSTTKDDNPRSATIIKIIKGKTTHANVTGTDDRTARYVTVKEDGINYGVGYWGNDIWNDYSIPLYIYGVDSDINIDFGG